jgi:Uma2 family endonuclease
MEKQRKMIQALILDFDGLMLETEYGIITVEHAQADDRIRKRAMAQRKYFVMSVEDYLILNKNSKDARYEYLDGEIRMLAGGSPDHSIIIANLTATIKGPLRGNQCRVYNSDVQLKLSEKRYVFPDITVSCDERDRSQKETIRYPRLVVEVLSPSTEATDRGRKAAYYRACPTIQEYMMVDSEDIFVEVHRREGEIWTINTFEPGNIITLESLGIQFPIEDAYEGTSLTYEP